MSGIPRFHRTQLSNPRYLKGYGNDEFLYFDWDPSLDPSKFRVLVESLSGQWEHIGQLKKTVYVPNVHYPEHAMLVVVGVNRKGEQVRHLGELRRGHFYRLESSVEGDHYMTRMIPQRREPLSSPRF